MLAINEKKLRDAHAAAIAVSIKKSDRVVVCPDVTCGGQVPVVNADLERGYGAYCIVCHQKAL